MPTILVPAYGRSYATRQEALDDWNAGLDFKIEGGPYCSNADREVMRGAGHNVVSIRWAPNLYLPV